MRQARPAQTQLAGAGRRSRTLRDFAGGYNSIPGGAEPRARHGNRPVLLAQHRLHRGPALTVVPAAAQKLTACGSPRSSAARSSLTAIEQGDQVALLTPRSRNRLSMSGPRGPRSDDESADPQVCRSDAAFDKSSGWALGTWWLSAQLAWGDTDA
jgi:hypothetical protein